MSDTYLDDNGLWRNKNTNRKFNLNIKHCEKYGCNNRVRNNGAYCSKHIDWSKTAHGASLLSHNDVCFISQKVHDGFSDFEITKEIEKKEEHKNHTHKSILLAVRHHRRKYLTYRYNKFNYKSIKLNYGKKYTKCAICGWNETSIDVHHILQERDFNDNIGYHQEDNLISLCPNHHRIVEYMRKVNSSKYISYIKKYKRSIKIEENNMTNNNEVLNLIMLQEQVLDLTIRVRVLESLLIKNSAITKEEYIENLERATKLVSSKIEEAYSNIEAVKDKIKELNKEEKSEGKEEDQTKETKENGA